jgi:AcrR family transcriptional regulator
MAASPATPLAPPRRGEARAERILDAAEELFAERGYRGTALRDVAARAGLRTPSLYNHFPSKQSLYAAVLARGLGPLLAILSPVDGSARDPGRIVGEVMALLAEHPNLPRLVLHETLSGGPRLTPWLRGWLGPALARAHELVEANPAARRWDREEVPLLVLALYHAVVGYFTIAPLYHELRGEELLREEALARQTRFLERLVATLLPEGPRPGDRHGC